MKYFFVVLFTTLFGLTSFAEESTWYYFVTIEEKPLKNGTYQRSDETRTLSCENASENGTSPKEKMEERFFHKKISEKRSKEGKPIVVVLESRFFDIFKRYKAISYFYRSKDDCEKEAKSKSLGKKEDPLAEYQ